MFNFKVVAFDTDSLFMKKQNQEPFSEEEQEALLQSLNAQFGAGIRWELNGLFSKLITLKAKNYIMYDGKSIKIKGSGLKSSKTEPAFKEFMNEIIESMVYDRNNYLEIYNKYVKEIMDVKDIKRFATKKTYTNKIDTSERTNETKVKDAIAGSEYVEGDKIYLYYKPDDTMSLIENFNGDYNRKRLLKRIYDTIKIFRNVLDLSIFLNYSLKKNNKQLEELNAYK